MKRYLTTLLVLTAAILLGSQSSAWAKGWGGADNPDWNNTAVGTAGGARCAGYTNNSFSGSLKGQDGLAINATIGFDFVDANNQTVDINTGCSSGGAYSTILQLNHYVGYRGATIGSVQYDAKGVAQGRVSATWTISHLPANVTAVWIETYPRAYTGSPCGMGCAGTSNVTKYGMTNRRLVPVSQRSVNLVAPITPAFGGTTGQIQVQSRNSAGSPLNLRPCGGTVKTLCWQAHVWSTNSPEGSMVQGWGYGTKNGTTTWLFQALASGQQYKIWFQYYDANGVGVKRIQAYTQVYRAYTSKLTMHM